MAKVAKAKVAKPKLVNCRYPKCHLLHASTELSKDEAIFYNNRYYHNNCLHTMLTVMKIKDLFIQRVDPTLTAKQIGMLVSTVNNIVFSKHIDVDFVLFAVQWIVDNKPGVLKYPAGIHYIIQDNDVKDAWNKEKRRQIKASMQEAVNQLGKELNSPIEIDFGTPESKFVYKPQRQKSFADILR